MAPPRDQARRDLLEYLYHSFVHARSRKKQNALVSEMKRALKAKGYRESDVAQALTFLIDQGWVTEEKETWHVATRTGPKQVERIRYRITARGVEHFEGISAFDGPERLQGINIMNVQGITVVGHDNVVQTRFHDLYEAMDHLDRQIRMAPSLSDQEKLGYQADIQTIKTQLAKRDPDVSILRSAWQALTAAAAIDGIAGAFQRASELMRAVLPL